MSGDQMETCPHCQTHYWAITGHYCPARGRNVGFAPSPPLTEADVRRIVDEQHEGIWRAIAELQKRVTRAKP